ncbi:nuclear transport factor 2 family protein [Kushneria aurantia]|uniref:Nuclear transport factor 2 family protein n=1 Tax=Kushneria aurantia TaxID=504092 RepID=A0ABV6G899_9GAMM|nr:nuclear transport factor 2 family protein [Kushneria aurantia]
MDTLPPIIVRYIAAYNDMDIASMIDCLSDDVRFLNKFDGQVTNETNGRAEFRALAEQGVAAFSERRQTVSACIAMDDRAALRIDYNATVRCDLPNGWKTGQEIAMKGTSFFSMAGGKITEIIDAS